MFKKVLFFLSLTGAFYFCFWLYGESLFPKLPSEEEPVCFYASQCRQDLKRVLLTSMQQAKQSLHIVTFGLNDLAILRSLEDLAKKGISMKVFYDRKASDVIHLSNHEAFPLRMKGFMHQKIVIVDEKITFLGSVNLTHTSLQMHDNILLGFYHPQLSQFLQKNTPFYPGYFCTFIGKQKIEVYLLPDKRRKAFDSLQMLLHTAKRKITVCMFTLTHPLLINELILAHGRGVELHVIIDYHSALGASAKAVASLQKAGVPVFLHQGSQLFHHKYAEIDEKVLICGSTNWTKAAFEKNQDCFVILHNLSDKQKAFLRHLEKISMRDSEKK